MICCCIVPKGLLSTKLAKSKSPEEEEAEEGEGCVQDVYEGGERMSMNDERMRLNEVRGYG